MGASGGLPVRREHGLHLARDLLDRLVPADATMRGAEGRHGLNELIDLGMQKRATILRPKCLDPVCCPILPGLHRERIARPVELHPQIASGVAEDKVETITADVYAVTVTRGRVVFAERILPRSRAEAVHIIAGATNEGVIAGAAIEGVIASVAGEGIRGAVASEDVVGGIPRAVDGCGAG